MKIAGLQKTTLLDYPGKVACTIFTPGCDFRCPYCHNASLVTHIDESQIIPEEKVLAFLKKRIGILDGVCITGGEPMLQPDLEEFLSKVKALGYSIKLDTNGSNPEFLWHMIQMGYVDYVAMDVKQCLEKYAQTIGRTSFPVEHICDSINCLLEGRIPYEFRTTVVEELHDIEDFALIGEFCQGAQNYYLQRFEDSGDLISSDLTAPSMEKMLQILQVIQTYIPSAKIRGN